MIRFHQYADDSKLHYLFPKFPEVPVWVLNQCFASAITWQNKWQLNLDKTEIKPVKRDWTGIETRDVRP